MEEASRDSPDNMQKLPEKSELTKLQKDIYEFLLKDKSQKALAIAKAMGKTCVRDVNPDLYKMQGWNLLDCNENKLWSIKAVRRASETKAEIENANKTGPTASRPLTCQQEEIFTFLEKNRPMRAMDIAKGVGKNKAKDVNPDLYVMQKMDLLTHSKEEKLWTVKRQNNTRCKEGNEECEETRSTIIPSDSNHSDDATSLNQTGIENQDKQLCEDTQRISSPDHKVAGCQCSTQSPNSNNAVQIHSHTVLQPAVFKTYHYLIQNSQNFSIGDGVRMQELDYAAGESTALSGASGGWYLDSDLSNSTQSQNGSLNDSNLSAAEEILEQPQHTSSPSNPDQSHQRVNTSDVCDGITQLNLQQKNNSLW